MPLWVPAPVIPAHPGLATHDGLGLATDAEVAVESAARATHAALTTGAHGGLVAATDPRVVNAASKLYVRSRLENLFTNGSGLMGDNTNMSQFTFDRTELHGGGGSFLKNANTTGFFADELIPVDPTQMYKLSGWAKSGETGGANFNPANVQYLGVNSVDIEGVSVNPIYYTKHAGSTDTTLAAQLNPGDTTVTLTTAAGWQNAGTGYERAFVWYPFTNSFGYSYPDYTYSRNHASQYIGGGVVIADWPTNGIWLASGISGNVITLRGPWTGPTLAVGTKVRNSTSGGTYKYIAAPGATVPNDWTRYEGHIGTTDLTGNASVQRQFPPGTAFIQVIFLVNYHGAADNNIRWSDLSFGLHPDAIQSPDKTWWQHKVSNAGAGSYATFSIFL